MNWLYLNAWATWKIRKHRWEERPSSKWKFEVNLHQKSNGKLFFFSCLQNVIVHLFYAGTSTMWRSKKAITSRSLSKKASIFTGWTSRIVITIILARSKLSPKMKMEKVKRRYDLQEKSNKKYFRKMLSRSITTLASTILAKWLKAPFL